jgi:hypothetical protein
MNEEQLINHYEYVAYTDKRTEYFFDIYLPQKVQVKPKDLFIGKKKDTDLLFRRNTIELLSRDYDSICSKLTTLDAILFTKMLLRLEGLAGDKNTFFQRSVARDCIAQEFRPSSAQMYYFTTILDHSFALANADTSVAKPLSLILNQLTGKWLSILLTKTYGRLNNLICALSWQEIYELSNDDDWRNFISNINTFIYVIQRVKQDKFFPIAKLSRFLFFSSFGNILKDIAIDVVKQKFFEYGLISEAQNIERMIDVCTDCYNGRYKILLDVIEATDMFANRLVDKLGRQKDLVYLISYEKKQKRTEYDITSTLTKL